uniref:Uncharacterized protein n=1 Tax=Vitis vinifera TaxID=29760 RepID=F6HLX5_VITVI
MIKILMLVRLAHPHFVKNKEQEMPTQGTRAKTKTKKQDDTEGMKS